jgi:hypothetical protein
MDFAVAVMVSRMDDDLVERESVLLKVGEGIQKRDREFRFHFAEDLNNLSRAWALKEIEHNDDETGVVGIASPL